jgi:hypothetical protein
MQHTLTTRPDPRPATRSLTDRDEFGHIAPGTVGLFARPVIPLALLDARDPHGRPAPGWVPDEYLL